MGALGFGILAGGSIISGLLGSHAATSAANAQAGAVKYAADLARQSELDALQYQREAAYNARSDMLPWLQTGTGAIYQLGNLMGVPTPAGNQNYPGPAMPYSTTQQGQDLGNLQNQLDELNRAYAQLPSAGLGALGSNADKKRELENRIAGTQAMINEIEQGKAQQQLTGNLPQGLYNQSGESAFNLGQTGELALPMSEVMKNWQTEPGYEFRLNQGENAVNNYLAARGMPFGGTAAKALIDYNQGMASQEYSNVYNRTAQDRTDRFNRLASLAGIGQTAAQQTGSYAMNTANTMGNIGMQSAALQGDYATQSANARASSSLYNANLWGNVGNTLGQLPLAYDMYKKMYES